jgi:hypothetical protein
VPEASASKPLAEKVTVVLSAACSWTVKVYVAVLVRPPAAPTIITVYVPVGVPAAVEMVKVLVKVGLPEEGLRDANASEGRPVAERLTV